MIRKTKIFCTLGPSSMNKDVIVRLDSLGVDMFRINLSHTAIDDIERVISHVRQCTDKPICLDTEGAQIRIGRVVDDRVCFEEGRFVDITRKSVVGDQSRISFNPSSSIDNIKPGDLISIDFESVLLQAVRCAKDSLTAKVISGGSVGSNKAVTIDREIDLPVISAKDEKAIKIGLENGIRDYALSFAGSAEGVRYFRKKAGRTSRIISKIESKKGVENLDEILKLSDAILIDRGDLSREEPIEKIPFLQKLIIRKANQAGVPVYVATNLLESMVKSKTPTRAEVNDVVNTLADGADGLVLAAETAIGSYPSTCVAMVSKVIRQFSNFSENSSLEDLERHDSFLLVEPHGGVLVNRIMEHPDAARINRHKMLKVDRSVLLDAEQIAIGTFSPLQGFMKKKELDSVLKNYMLPGGVLWPLPVVLQVSKDNADRLKKEKTIALTFEEDGEVYAILHLEEIYAYDLDRMAGEVFGTTDISHPGIKSLKSKGKHFLGGKIDLVKRLPSEHKHFEITPKQARAIFENKGWRRVVGFHTRNVIHNVHEHIQMLALEKYHCDGIFVHPVVGPKKPGDYTADIILKCYELVIDNHYPKGRAILGAFQSYSRYAGPREAVFTALCRKNFGCSHFIIGRDHTGFGNHYKPYDVHRMFERIGNIGITPIFFREVSYCKACKRYVEKCGHEDKHILNISGSRAREIFRTVKRPPGWFMRKEVSDLILDGMKKGERVFIPPPNTPAFRPGIDGAGCRNNRKEPRALARAGSIQ